MDETYIQVSRLMLQAKAFVEAAHQYQEVDENPTLANLHIAYAVGIMQVVDRVPSLNHEERMLRAKVTRMIEEVNTPSHPLPATTGEDDDASTD